MFNVSAGMVTAFILAFFGFVASVSGVILHLRVSGVFTQVKVEIGKIDTRIQVEVGKLENRIEQVRAESTTAHAQVQLSIEQMKTKLAESNAESYKQIMGETKRNYMDRDLADSKHNQNVQRLDSMTDEIREFRKGVDRRLTLIEERLPV